MLDALLGRIVPLEIVVAVQEVDVILVEDGGPLEWCGYLRIRNCLIRLLMATVGQETHRVVFDRSCSDTTCCPKALPCSIGISPFRNDSLRRSVP